MRIIGAVCAIALASCAQGGATNISGQLIVEDAPGSPPTCATSTTAGELCVEGDIETNGNADVAGTSTLTGAVTAASTLTAAGALTASSTLGVTGMTTLTGGVTQATAAISGTTALTSADCGIVQMVDAGIDTETITLPATSAGCVYEFIYTGADGGALLDISPAAADAVHGSCTLAASVLELSGADDADFGFTKATINTGDRVTIVGDGSVGWFVSDCAGILANN